MRALFWKEWRQSHLLPWVGFLLSAMIAVLYWAWNRSYVKTARDWDDLNAFCAFCCLIASAVMVLVAAAGTFATERARGTLAYLLGLPLSRSRIWAAKALAGVALALAGAALLVGPLGLALPQVFREVRVLLYLPHLAAWGLLVCAGTLFWSTLLARTISVLLAALVTLPLLGLGLAVLATSVGRLLGYDDLLDASLWALAVAVSFLLASLVGFARGELLQSRRRWAAALGALGVSLLAIGLLMVVPTRVAFGYRRGGVRVVAVRRPSGESTVVTAVVSGSATPYPCSARAGRHGASHTYRSVHTIALDLNTGRELPLGPGEVQAYPSPDGKRVAVVGRTLVLTWGEPIQLGLNTVEVRELPSGRRLSRWSVGDGRQVIIGVAWSPNGDWLAVESASPMGAGLPGEEGPVPAGPDELVLVKADGFRQVRVGQRGGLIGLHGPRSDRAIFWRWAADGSGIYTTSWRGRVTFHRLPDGKAAVVWEAARSRLALPSSEARGWFLRVEPSPDGKWLALSGSQVRRGPGEEERGEGKPWVGTLAIRSDGSAEIPIAAVSAYRHGLGWSRDGGLLNLAGLDEGRLTLRRWRPGEAEAKLVPIPEEIQIGRCFLLPDGGAVLLWAHESRYWLVDHGGRVHGPMSLDHEDHCQLVGVDRQGWGVASSYGASQRVVRVDLASGQATPLYP